MGNVSEQLERIYAEVADQDALLEQALTALELKAAGAGATSETWVLTLNNGTTIEKQVVVVS